MTTAVYAPAPSRPALRPLALPTEHGGWGFLFEPILLGLAVAPSAGGALIAVAFVFGFLTRQPLRLALQDASRGRAYPRTRWCWLFALGYAAAGALALGGAVAISGSIILIPIGLAAPMGLTQILYDANNRSRALLPELAGTAAMASSAVAIAIAGHMRIVPAFALAGVLVARAVPTILYVRALLMRSHGRSASSTLPLAMHGLAIILVALFAPRMVMAAMAVLFVRAAWGLAHPPPAAKTLGWTEVVWGAVTVALAIAGFRL